MRAMLIANPIATSITPAARELVTHALESRVQLTVANTEHAGHADELGRTAVAEGYDLVVVHGGDGTVSAVVNGMLGRPGSTPPGPVPALGIIPGGSANVLARALGIHRDPAAASNQLINLLDEYERSRQWRRISLIDCGEVYALVNAGMGVDAEVVEAVEKERKKGHKITPLRYWRVAVPVSVRFSRRDPNLILELPDREPVSGVHFVWVSNTNPWTYSDDRPMVTNPGCSFESGLGIFALTSMKLIPTLRLLRQLLAKRPKLEAKQLIRDDDVSYARITKMAAPAACQYDGEYLGLRDSMTFRVVPSGLAVVAPRPGSE
ncbi:MULTISPECIES: diacylglycerol/lipid kinase family protein [Mycobacterium]|uniref:Diacylglycerol kinase n=1 Tax=Mycobacterium kiyosense TaxID=2871094 RepID=A0A9P3Q431_9MYCO|nr:MULTISPECIES: diacylglycerol kinase family protein [Mycobacterium]BDB40938.1 diacylglycerol kinase [Mycobacterium kiyosense]BDE12735.1 diacylglycerol kinase [Mycobacterium sp. 20KCMC460]GLB82676.1 diacylglycerol kinase [Mycobacterium kiyosense]GLB87818.1 diacylglycerol kinase [Mycobacterium kiyosense]GLB93975.1 diacylglycerol kinase [Mycobacterium kiyosense]